MDLGSICVSTFLTKEEVLVDSEIVDVFEVLPKLIDWQSELDYSGLSCLLGSQSSRWVAAPADLEAPCWRNLYHFSYK